MTAPNGRLIYDGDPVTQEWFEARRTGITATDVAAICVPNPYRNARHVALEKWGQLPRELAEKENEAAKWGTLLEPVVADVWADLHGTTVRPVGVIAAVDAPWRIASLDRLVDLCPDGDGPCGLEIKTRNAYSAQQWRGDIPDDVLAQTLWQMVVTGFRHMHVACLIGGQRMVSARVAADTEHAVVEHLITEATRVWENVQAGVLPDAPYDDAMADLLEAQFRDGTVGDPRVLPVEDVTVLVGAYQAATAQEKAAKAAKTAARARILEALDRHEALAYVGEDGLPVQVAAYGPGESRSVTASAVETRFPEAWKVLLGDGAAKVTPYRKLTVRASALPTAAG